MGLQYSSYGDGSWYQPEVNFEVMFLFEHLILHYFVYYFRTGEVQQTRSYISSVYPEDHQYGQSVLAFYSEGYCKIKNY